ncbi:uncharacterized protein HMPREF1541_03370 [Cyphellophora europaea CBS 101466]|uniref:SGNH hydrolase-type esterase domain-containing protein n=1 Tax=Cyphellophora europaea (strain CBS 101466) TaxID=1220924 RepID=W2S0I0_CYPE1|nr:uncharacterized protein HMPREF1541_03370 [Cyphellophora europaea CBS 101466]ETN41434.1 hypothetical protein HMPREF1541_03370 [Cyphellophora europaea CBS 101466]
MKLPECSHSSSILLLFTSLVQPSATRYYAALSDSYAAGDGAGSPRLPPHREFGCGRFDGAYPVLLANNFSLLIPPSGFTNVACGGASSTSVRTTQVPYIGDADFVTVTVGGNEIDFFVVLNACVHQWFPGGDCDAEIVRAREAVQAGTLLRRYGEMIAAAKKTMKDDARLLVTGYARFFNSQTTQCDHVSFSRRDPDRVLSREMRVQFNAIVGMLNDVIEASAEAHGASYVDIDQVFDGHRFCEEGVVEPSSTNQTWFFNLEYPQPRTAPSAGQHVLPGPIKDYLDMTRAFHPNALGHKAIAEKIAQLILNR